MVPIVVSAIALLWTFQGSADDLGYAITAIMALCLLVILPFPVVLLYQYRKWLKWSRERQMDASL